MAEGGDDVMQGNELKLKPTVQEVEGTLTVLRTAESSGLFHGPFVCMTGLSRNICPDTYSAVR